MIVNKIENMAADMFNCKDNKLMIVFLFYVAISKTLQDKYKEFQNPQIEVYFISRGMHKTHLRIKNLERICSKKDSSGQNMSTEEPIIYKKLKKLCQL